MKIIVVFSLLVAGILVAPYQITQTLASSEPLIVNEPRVWLSKGGALFDAYSIEQKPLFVRASVQNPSSETHEYLIVLEIRKLSDGITVFLEIQSAITEATKDESIYMPWTPEEAGEYQVRTFLISNLTRPEILSSVITSETSIYDNSFKGMIQVKKSACDGECPEYIIEVYQNRTTIFDGGSYVAKPGRFVFEVSQDQITQLIDAFYDANFFSLDDVYGYPFDDGAERVRIYASINSTTKTVTTDYGPNVPDNFLDLQEQIHEILGTGKWVTGE